MSRTVSISPISLLHRRWIWTPNQSYFKWKIKGQSWENEKNLGITTIINDLLSSGSFKLVSCELVSIICDFELKRMKKIIRCMWRDSNYRSTIVARNYQKRLGLVSQVIPLTDKTKISTGRISVHRRKRKSCTTEPSLIKR